MASYLIGIELETSDLEVWADIISTLETVLPYMADNVGVQSRFRSDAETDNDGQRILYFGRDAS